MHKRRTREAESTDASIRRGLPHSSDDAGVMLAERRGQVTGVGMEPTCKGRSPNTQWKTAVFARWHEPDEARVSRPESVSGSGGSSPGRLGGGTARCPPIPIHPQTNLPVRKIFMSRQKKPNNPERANACSARKLILPQLLRLAGASNDFADLGRRESALRHLSRAGK